MLGSVWAILGRPCGTGGPERKESFPGFSEDRLYDREFAGIQHFERVFVGQEIQLQSRRDDLFVVMQPEQILQLPRSDIGEVRGTNL